MRRFTKAAASFGSISLESLNCKGAGKELRIGLFSEPAIRFLTEQVVNYRIGNAF